MKFIFRVERKVGNVLIRISVLIHILIHIVFCEYVVFIMLHCIIYRMVNSGRFLVEKERKVCN